MLGGRSRSLRARMRSSRSLRDKAGFEEVVLDAVAARIEAFMTAWQFLTHL